jgi:hypothetical protein
MDGELAGSTDFGNGVVRVLMEVDQTAGLEALSLFELKKWDWIGTEVERSCFFEHFIAAHEALFRFALRTDFGP